MENQPRWFQLILWFIGLINWNLEFSWQCPRCNKWDWGTSWYFSRAAYYEVNLDKCIKHKEL
jgi:hypothetical protein